MRLVDRIILLSTLLLVAPALGAAHPKPAGPACRKASCAVSRLVYFGTRADGAASGIYAARFDEAVGHLTALGMVAKVDRPTWLLPSPHRPVLYAVSEVGNDGKSQAAVLSFNADVATGALALLTRVDSGGGGATHLALNTHSPSLIVANYGTGTVGVVPLQPGGKLLPVSSVATDTGSGPSPRQKSPHAHGALIDRTGRFVLVSDLGADRIFIYRFDPATMKLVAADMPFVAVKPGSGPRHLAMTGDGRFVFANMELTGEIATFRWDEAAGRLSLVRTISASPADYAGEKSAGEIGLSPDGRFLYASTRGEDAIVVYAVDPSTGVLREIQRLPAGGKQPWSFTLDPSGRWLLVADQGSNLVAVFRRNSRTGKLIPTDESLAIPNVSSVALVHG